MPLPHTHSLVVSTLSLEHSDKPQRRSRAKVKKKKKTNMSWQTYVDDHLMCDVAGNRLTAAAILGQDGSVWAQSNNFPQVRVYFYTDYSILIILLFLVWFYVEICNLWFCLATKPPKFSNFQCLVLIF